MERIIQVMYIYIHIYVYIWVYICIYIYYHFLVVDGQPYPTARYIVNLVCIPSTCILSYKQWFPVCTEPSHYLGKYSSKKYEIAFLSMIMKYHWTQLKVLTLIQLDIFFLSKWNFISWLVSKTVIYFSCWKLVKYKVHLGNTVGADSLVLQHQGICSCGVDYTPMCLQLFMG